MGSLQTQSSQGFVEQSSGIQARRIRVGWWSQSFEEIQARVMVKRDGLATRSNERRRLIADVLVLKQV
ncbi:MAG: hypothetical protein Q9185_002178 [Variospora sp. 1 TL-2023]